MEIAFSEQCCNFLCGDDEQNQNLRRNTHYYINNNKGVFNEFKIQSEVDYFLENGGNNEVRQIIFAFMLDLCVIIFSPGYNTPLRFNENGSSEINLFNSNKIISKLFSIKIH